MQTIRQRRALSAANTVSAIAKLWARIRVAQLCFDMWYSRKMAAMDERDAQICDYQYRLELAKQQDIAADLRKWRAKVAA